MTNADDLHGFYFEDLKLDMSATFSKTVTEADIVNFAGISGDFNPVHINEEFAETTPFKGRIAHGMLTAGLISTVLGMYLPGPGCIYVNQTLRFKAPVRIGDTVTAKATVKELRGDKSIVVLDTVCTVQGHEVLVGEAMLMVDRRGA